MSGYSVAWQDEQTRKTWGRSRLYAVIILLLVSMGLILFMVAFGFVLADSSKSDFATTSSNLVSATVLEKIGTETNDSGAAGIYYVKYIYNDRTYTTKVRVRRASADIATLDIISFYVNPDDPERIIDSKNVVQNLPSDIDSTTGLLLRPAMFFLFLIGPMYFVSAIIRLGDLLTIRRILKVTTWQTFQVSIIDKDKPRLNSSNAILVDTDPLSIIKLRGSVVCPIHFALKESPVLVAFYGWDFVLAQDTGRFAILGRLQSDPLTTWYIREQSPFKVLTTGLGTQWKPSKFDKQRNFTKEVKNKDVKEQGPLW